MNTTDSFYYVCDTTFVPMGEEPVILLGAMPYKEALEALASFKATDDGGFFELIEA